MQVENVEHWNLFQPGDRGEVVLPEEEDPQERDAVKSSNALRGVRGQLLQNEIGCPPEGRCCGSRGRSGWAASGARSAV